MPGCHRHDHARRLRACRAAGKRQQSDIARPLDGHAQPALVTGAYAGHAPGQNLPAFLHELRQDVRTLVVNKVHLFDAELANLLLAEILALAPRPSPWTAGPTAPRPAFAALATAMSASGPVAATMAAPDASQVWVAPIETVSESEEGFERVYQGSQILAVWPVNFSDGALWRGSVSLHIEPARPPTTEAATG